MEYDSKTCKKISLFFLIAGGLFIGFYIGKHGMMIPESLLDLVLPIGGFFLIGLSIWFYKEKEKLNNKK